MQGRISAAAISCMNANIKILVTLGPGSMNETAVCRMTELGVHLFRLNMSHTSIDDLEDTIGRIRSWTDVPISLDSEGA